MNLLLSMGVRPRARRPLAPRLRVLDPDRGALVREVELLAAHPPPDGDQAAAPHRDGDLLWQPTRTALHRVDLRTWQVREVLSHPLFHDVHSVSPGPEGWLVTCTGHEAVVEIDEAGTVLRRVELGPSHPAGRDYRDLPHDAFKPHAVHPNRAFMLHGRVWVTCLGKQACVGLDHEGRVALPGPPHDGVLREGLLWFTTTDGHVVAVEPERLEVVLTLDVHALDPGEGMPGWCRGIEVVGDRLFVGMTQLRKSRWREAARQAVRGASGRKRPTRVVEIDWRAGALRAVHEVGDEGVIYGITAVG